jgi:hypothetical protein
LLAAGLAALVLAASARPCGAVAGALRGHISIYGAHDASLERRRLPSGRSRIIWLDMGNPAIEAQQLSQESIAFARGIGHATTGEKLGAVLKQGLREQPGAYNRVRAAVRARLDELGGVGEELGLFMLAADMATTEALYGDRLSASDRTDPRRLWNDLRSR